MNNILYLINHKTLCNYEIPIIINKGYGVFVSKKINGFDIVETSSFSINNDYDYSLNLNKYIIEKLNIDWYDNNILIEQEVIDILNNNFKFIFITLLTNGILLNQLIKKFNGNIFYRLFGREGEKRYNSLCSVDNKLKYIFGYPEIYIFENTFDNFFNSNNSYVVKMGISDAFITKYTNTYLPINNKICVICSKINNCPYYTNVYNNFILNFENYNYVILGKNNINAKNAINDLNDEMFYKTFSNCKLLYYHSKEPRHLHYHPLEAIIIGIPIIFHKECLLTSYLPDSLGKCDNMIDAKNKIDRIMNNDIEFINTIINEQNKTRNILNINYNKNMFDLILN